MIAYSTNRPIGLGTWPSQHRDKVVAFHHFDKPTFVPEIRRTSFGYIEFSEDIPKEDLDAYELKVPCEEDETLQRIVQILWRYVDDDKKFEKCWQRALRKGYTEDELGRAFDDSYEKYGK
ncbi:MAG: hypothetical protein IKF14_13360 [Atopobiaceae bacterium]|nr:hypothetical protein [Atopobiaceae bacterium]MBR3160069.1 hypothetical protein [Atopobiaceae bacterium]